MRSLGIFALLATLWITSCGSDSTSPTSESQAPVLASGTIGTGGGELTAPGIRLTVPSGAFADDAQLIIRTGTQAFPEDDGAWATQQYKLEGVPSQFTEPLTIDLAITGTGDGDPAVLVGETVFVKSLGAAELAWQPFEAVDIGDTLRIELPATAASGKAVVDYEYIDLPLGGTFYYTTTSSSHFKVFRPLPMTDQAAALCGYLEEAYTDIAALGFSYDRRTRWPVRVVVLAMPSNRYGEAVGSVWGYDYTSLRFSTGKMGEAAAMRRTAGHEFFHLVQDFYDPRSAYDRATGASRHYWVDEAASVWAEAFFTDEADYVSPIRDGLVGEPFDSIHAVVTDNAAHHGYGMSALFKWLATHHGDTVVRSTYDHILAGEHPARAVELAVGSGYSDWLADFHHAYFSGSVYGESEIPYMIAANVGSWTIDSLSDVDHSWTKYPTALGALILQVKLRAEGMAEGREAKVSISGDSPRTLAVFSYNISDGANLLGSDPDSVVVGDLKGLQEAGKQLIIVTTNPLDDAPHYLATATHEVQVEVRESSPILEALQRSSGISYMASVTGGTHHFRTSDTNGTTDFTSNGFPSMGGSMIPGDIFGGPWPALQFDGTSFSTELSYQGSVDLWEWTISGSFDASGTRLLSLTAYGETRDEVYDEGAYIGDRFTTLTFNFSNIDLMEGYQLEEDSCYLPYRVQATPPSIQYAQECPWVDDEGATQVTTTSYLGSDWSAYSMYGFVFTQSAP